MSVITPTLGRIVWFTPSKGEHMATEKDGRCAAMVVKVHSDRLVNLTVFDANGHTTPRTSVPLVQEGDPLPTNGFYCEWMPYQKGQAQKTEASEQALAQAKK